MLLLEEENIEVSLIFKEKTVKKYIKLFFKGLSDVEGEKFNDQELFQEHWLNLVRNISIVDAVEIGYQIIQSVADNGGFFVKMGPVKKNDEIRCFIYVLKRCESLRIPRDYIGGLFLLYIHLCEGIPLK